MVKSLLSEISEKDGLYAVGARIYLQSPSYSDEKALSFLYEIIEQSHQATKETYKMFGADLINRISSYLDQISKEVIVLKSNKAFTIQRTIYGSPSPGTLGDYWLLVDKYRREDPTWIEDKPDQWRRLCFNDQFMVHMQNHCEDLHCEKCGTENLRIYKWYEKKNYSDMSTVDHFLPRQTHPELTETPSNLFIFCYSCNNKKANKVLSKDDLKYRYDDNIRNSFIFDESKLSNKKFIKP